MWAIKCHVQLWWYDIAQIWMWFKESTWYFCKIKTSPKLMNRVILIPEFIYYIFIDMIYKKTSSALLFCKYYIVGLVQERCNSIANTLELRLSCTNPLRCSWYHLDGLVQESRNSTGNALELRLSCTNPSICLLCFQRSRDGPQQTVGMIQGSHLSPSYKYTDLGWPPGHKQH